MLLAWSSYGIHSQLAVRLETAKSAIGVLEVGGREMSQLLAGLGFRA